MPHGVFVSHSTVDADLAGNVVTGMAHQKITAFISGRDIAISSSWGQSIMQALAGCELVVLLMSHHAVASENVRDEILIAREMRKRIFIYTVGGFRFPTDLAAADELRLWLGRRQVHSYLSVAQIIADVTGALGLPITDDTQQEPQKVAVAEDVAPDQFVTKLQRVVTEVQKSTGQVDGVDKHLPFLRAVLKHLRFSHSELLATPASTATPPAGLVDVLRYFGWALYEASSIENRIPEAYVYQTGSVRDGFEHTAANIAELAEMSRSTPWPEFSLRGLGAIRSLALAYAKEDSVDGYRRAQAVHQELEDRLLRSADTIESGRFAGSDYEHDLKLDIGEMLEQHRLSEVATGCREAEHLLCRWVELSKAGEFDNDQQADAVASLANRLRKAITSGEAAVDAAARVHATFGLAQTKDEKRLLQSTSMANPSIMTARAYLHLIPMCGLMESYDAAAPFAGDTWAACATEFVAAFRVSYARIERIVLGSEPAGVPLGAHLRQLMQLRLTFMILCPYQQLSTTIPESALGGPLDLNDVEDLSAWLGTHRADAGVIGSANMPEYLSGIDRTRAGAGVRSGYRSWRRRWPGLDRFNDELGRHRPFGSSSG